MATNEMKNANGIEAKIIDTDDVDWHDEPTCDCEWWQGINLDALMDSSASSDQVHQLVCTYGVSADDINARLTPYGSPGDFWASVSDLITI